MYSDNADVSTVDLQKIRYSLIFHTPIEITTYTLPRNMEMYMQDILAKFLSVCSQENMTEYLSFCLGELLTNAKKANTKRVYFEEKGLDINSEKDYEVGMKTFRDDTFSNIDHYLEIQKKEGYYIKLILQIYNENLKVEIRNNARLTIFEEKRIQEKLKSVHKYSSVEEVLTQVLDQTEGSGLGIIIMVLMLQKVGLSENNYQVVSTDTETITRIILPMRGYSKELYLKMAGKLLEMRKVLPVFNDTIGTLQGMMNCPVDNKSVVLDFINKDVLLVMVLLREANKIQECFDLSQAYDLIGVEKLKFLFSSENSEIQLVERAPETMKYWGKALYSAFVAYNIASNFYKNLKPQEIYLYALIQDYTTLLASIVSKNEYSALTEVVKENEKADGLVDSFVHGAFHERTNQVFFDYWKFPKKIGEISLSHHDNEYAPEEYKEIVEILAFAETLGGYNVKIVDFYQIDKNLLKKYGIESQGKFDLFVSQLNQEFGKFTGMPKPDSQK